MNEKICLVTGATSGIGKATALGLAQRGAHVVLIARDPQRGEAARAEIQAASSGNLQANLHQADLLHVDLLVADLASQQSVRQLAADFKSRYPALHVLVNNAGIALTKRSVTEDGIERIFAVNYLAPFLLTHLLLEPLMAGAPSRVINVAGDYHRKATVRFDDLMSQEGYSGFRANNQAKLALILFTYELARRLEGSGVTVNALHPGAVATGSIDKDPDVPAFGRIMYGLVKPFFQSPAQGAQTSLYLACSPEVEGVTGGYFIKQRAVRSSPESYDEITARRLWDISLELTGLAREARISSSHGRQAGMDGEYPCRPAVRKGMNDPLINDDGALTGMTTG